MALGCPAIAPSLGFWLLCTPHGADPKGASGEISIYPLYLFYLFYTPARAPCHAACGAGCPRPPLCAAAVDARLTSEVVSVVNADELQPPARHAGTADRPAHAPAHTPARCASEMPWFYPGRGLARTGPGTEPASSARHSLPRAVLLRHRGSS